MAKHERQPTWCRAPVGTCLLGTLILLVNGCGDSDIVTVPEMPQPPLSVDAAALDFGDQLSTDHFVWTIPVRNVTQEPVTVTDFRGDCRCLSVDPPSFTIDSGGTQNVAVTLNLLEAGAGDDHLVTRELTATLADERATQVWRLQGRVRHVIDKPQEPLRFTVPYHDPDSPAPVVERRLLTPLADIRIVGNPSPARFRGTLVDDLLQLECVDGSGCPPGESLWTLKLAGTTDHGEQATLQLAVRIERALPAEMYPLATQFGALEIGAPAEATMRAVLSHPCDTWTIERAREVPEVGFEIESLDDARTLFRIRCRLESARAGIRTGVARLRLTFADGAPAADVGVPVSYYGLAANAEGVRP